MNDIRIGLSTRACRPEEPAPDFCERARSLGFAYLISEGALEQVLWWGGPGRPILQGVGLDLAALMLAPQVGAPRASLAAGAAEERQRVVLAASAIGACSQAAQLLIRVAAPPSDHVEILPGLGGVPVAPEPGSAPPSFHSSDLVLDQLCRGLHEIGGRAPGIRLCLVTPAEPGAPPLPDDIALLRSELPRLDLRFWHDVALAAMRAQREGIPVSRWLDGAEGALDGVLLADTDGQRVGLPVGVGLADLRGLRDALARETRIVVAIDADASHEALQMSMDAARDLAPR